jgi:heavy metal efflux system protein
MSGLVRWSAANPLLALLLIASLVALGTWSTLHLPIDAVPDVTNIQVQVVTQANALSANELEVQVTQPVERAMAGVPGLVTTRSITKLGMSLVTLVFRDDIDIYFARAQVNERLSAVRESIPADVGRPELGPIATGLGEIYMFELRSVGAKPRTAEELRTIVEWQVGPRLRQVKGVIEVIGFGGALKRYRVTLDPARLSAQGVSVEDVRAAIQRDNTMAGGGYVERSGEQVVLRGDARFRGVEDISDTVAKVAEQGLPIQIGQLATVDTGPALRQGAMTRDARGEIVGGSVLMLKGENSREVVERVKIAIDDLQTRLPPDVKIDPYYDRTDFINAVLVTVSKNLSEGAVLVVLCLLLTLGSLRAGFLVAGAIPFAMLMGIAGLKIIGYSGNVMSLGAVDFGIVVEGTVVLVEHALSHVRPGESPEARRRALIDAMSSVARPVLFGVVIVLLVFLPLATLEDQEGKMFRPVVYSLCFMLFGALIYAFVLVPAVGPAVFAKAHAGEPWLARKLRALYEPVVARVIARPVVTILSTFTVSAAMLAFGTTLGADFLPRIFEGSFAIDVYRPPSTSLSQAIDLSKETQVALLEAPEVVTVVDRIGRPENTIDPSGPEMSDVFIMLKPRDQWRKGMTPEKLAEDLSSRLDRRVLASINSFSQPIEMRVNDLIAGARGDVVVKVYGDDLDTMGDAADMIRKALAQVPGATDVKREIAVGLPSIRVTVPRARASRLGITPRAVLDVVAMARAGEKVGLVREGERVFDLVLRLGGEAIEDEHDLARLPIMSGDGHLVPMSNIAEIVREPTVVQIGREQMRRRLIVQANVRGRDVVGFVNEAQQRIRALDLPRGVELSWGGQFEAFNRAKARLLMLVPVALGVIALLLIITFRRLSYMFVTVLNLPFALAGGVLALVARGLPFSIPAGVGFIALCGVSVMNGVVMTNHLLTMDPKTAPEQRVAGAATGSLRAIISTALVAAIGFIPAAIATGTGAEVQRPLATVVIGGLVSAMLFSLPALPAMLLVVARRRR